MGEYSFLPGPLTKADKKFIVDNHTQKDEWIAEQLNRRPQSITRYREKYLIKNLVENDATFIECKNTLKSRPYWKTIRSQFSSVELDDFEYHWGVLVAQFKNDVTASEEMQILDLIKLEILVNRNLRQKRLAEEETDRVERAIHNEYDMPAAQQDKSRIQSLETTLASIRASQGASTTEYTKLHEKKQALMVSLKATRDQRIKILESSQSTFVALLKSLQDEKSLTRLQKETAIYKLALDKENERLSEYHKYLDDTLDQPILSEETLIEEEDKGNESR